MPAAYENYTTYAREVHRMQSVSPMTPGEQENFFTYNYDYRAMSTAGSFSPSSMESSMMESPHMEGSPQIDTCDDLSTADVFNIIGNTMRSDMDISIRNRTEIKILVQPVDKFRFRYISEMMGTHGSLLGKREETSHKKEVPSVQLINCPFKNAFVRCTLVTTNEDRRFPHAHRLVRKDGNTVKDDPHDIEVSNENNYVAIFCNMGIIHTAKKNIKEEILRKRKIEVMEEKKRQSLENATISIREDLKMKTEAEKAKKWMNLNSVALCFQGFCYGENNVLYPLTDKIYSRPINNLKSVSTAELKIYRIDKHTSSCEGNEEVWLLVDKVCKKNIKVKFYEVDEKDNIIWDADGRFSELDVHHQYAIVFKTPPYKDTNITTPKEVFLKLERPSDGEVSNSIKFLYKPSDKVLNRKRPRLSNSSGNLEFARNAQPLNPPLESCTPMAETFINLDNNNISNIPELKKLLNDANECNSADLKEFFNDNSTIEKLLNLMCPISNNGLTTDGGGAAELESSQEDFTTDILRQVMKILKEVESSSSTKLSAINKVRELLQETTYFGDTPLHYSLRHEQYETSKYLLIILGSDPSFKTIANLQNSSGKTPLHLAVLQNEADIVRALLKLGADPNLCDEEDASTLHNAVIVNAGACIDELIRSGTKLNLEAHTESGWSALHLAAKVGSLHAVKALIDAGADVNSTDMSYGRTALHIAVDSNHKHIVNYLLNKTKVDVNMKNFGGNTALHNAVVKGGKCAEELIKILKTHGADPTIRNNNVNCDEEKEDNGSGISSAQRTVDSSSTSTSESESSDADEDEPRPGESSFDLARSDPKLMQLLQDDRSVEPMEDEMMLQDRAMMLPPANFQEHRPPLPLTQASQKQLLQLPQTQIQQNQQPQQQFKPGDEKLTDAHVDRVKDILDRTGDWERLAQHTNQGSLVRLYKKTSSPSSALFVKIRQSDITVREVKKLLIEAQAHEAAFALET